jgi:hypothetical protein
MGCQCSALLKSSYEAIVDDTFNSLIIRKTELIDVMDNLKFKAESSYYLTETNFQTFFNKFLLPNDQSISKENKEIMFAFWLDFYRKKPSRLQFPLIKFTFAMLSKATFDFKNENESLKILLSIIEDYRSLKSKIDISEKNDKYYKYISLEELYFLLKDYIFSISNLSIEHFKKFHSNPQEFKEFLSKAWRNEILDNFIKSTFFTEEDFLHSKVTLKKFLKSFINILRDDNGLRKKITDYSINYHKSKEDEFSFAENKNLLD